MSEMMARDVGPARLDLAYECLGDPAMPPVLLIQGLGAQLIAWPDGFCAALAGHGLHVIRFDNRDVGRSARVPAAQAPDLPAVLAGDLSSAPYHLSDMAADAVGLLDALGIEAAHVVGVSMGGAIAQTLAIEHPWRVRSLTSMMSTTGDLSVGQVHPRAVRALFSGPPANIREQVVEQAVRVFRVIGSPGFPTAEAEIAERAGRAYDRGFDRAGIARQAVAAMASGDRTPALRRLDVPALVVHGRDDLMCEPCGGRATAAAIPGAELLLIDGMGHDLPRPLWPLITERIAALAERADRQTAGAALAHRP